MLSLRLPGLFIVLSLSLALSACGGSGSDTDSTAPVPDESTSGDDGTGADPAGSDGDTDGDPGEGSDGTDEGNSDNGSGSDTAPDADNRAPEIGGSPASEVMENADYRFTPTASDPDGDELSFTIENRPDWAQFDSRTGTLSGTPNYTHVGTTSGIVISVTDGALVAALGAFDVTVIDDGIGNGSAEISWTPPTTRSDGSPLTDLEGYRIHYGQDSGDYSETVEVGSGITSHVIEQLDKGEWFFAMTALDSEEVESDFSMEVSKAIDY